LYDSLVEGGFEKVFHEALPRIVPEEERVFPLSQNNALIPGKFQTSPEPEQNAPESPETAQKREKIHEDIPP
jgi:hypothetical protein